ncbi:MAG: hypothetical protein ACOY0S_01250 [Patescibacteria group bacterium]
MRILFVLLYVLLYSLINSTVAFANTTNSGLSLSPPFKEIELAKDTTQSTFFIEIANNTTALQTLYLSVVDFGTLDESGGVAFLGIQGEKLERKYSLASWVSLEKDIIEIEGGKSQKVKITILNKESLSPGGHYAAVIATTPSTKEEKNVSFESALASLIFVKKTGGEIYKLNLVEKEISSRILGFPNKISLRFQNSGNVHVVPRGTVEILDPRGTKISKGVINDESGIILPESFRLYPTSLTRSKWPIMPGKYNLNIQYRFDGKEDFSRDSSPFFFPGIIGIGLPVILLVGLILLILKRRFKKQ